MAGHPKRKADLERFMLALDDICDAIRGGATDKAACTEHGVVLAGTIYTAMERDATVAAKVERARREGAAAMASQTVDIADELAKKVKADPVRVAQARIGTRQWLAGKRNREAFGEQRGPQVQLNIGALHLTAARAAQHALPVIEGEAVPVERKPDEGSVDDLL